MRDVCYQYNQWKRKNNRTSQYNQKIKEMKAKAR